MGVAALVLGICAIVLAWFGGLGGIFFGVAAVVLGILGRRAAERSGLPRGSATAGVVTGLVGIVLGGVLFAAFVRCAKVEGEASRAVHEIARLEMAYYEAERLDEKGNRRPRAFVSAAPVPATIPCQRQPVTVTPEEWKAAGWDAIRFAPSGPTRFQFEAMARGEGKDARLVIFARADTGCDGTLSDLRQRVAINAEGRPQLVGPRDDWRYGVRPGRVKGTAAPPGEEDLPDVQARTEPRHSAATQPSADAPTPAGAP